MVSLSLVIGMTSSSNRTAGRVARRYLAMLHGRQDAVGLLVEDRVLEAVTQLGRDLIQRLRVEPSMSVHEMIGSVAEIVREAEDAERLIPF